MVSILDGNSGVQVLSEFANLIFLDQQQSQILDFCHFSIKRAQLGLSYHLL